MKEDIIKKFEGISHKWFLIDINTKSFSKLKIKISKKIKEGFISGNEAINLFSAFKKHKKAWLKLKAISGRKNNIVCLCEISTEKNKKIFINLTPEEVLNSKVLVDTPKKLKLYSINKDEWKISPFDKFVDKVKYPPIEEEFTESGYEVYKSWQLEVNKSGMTSTDYYIKYYSPNGGSWCRK